MKTKCLVLLLSLILMGCVNKQAQEDIDLLYEEIRICKEYVNEKENELFAHGVLLSEMRGEIKNLDAEDKRLLTFIQYNYGSISQNRLNLWYNIRLHELRLNKSEGIEVYDYTFEKAVIDSELTDEEVN